MSEKVLIFDTTLRDGEQSPGASMNLEEKVSIAKCLEELKVDIIEAGFPIASKGDFESVQAIASEIKDCQIAGLARAKHEDIETAWNAIKKANNPRIHTFIATSPIHMQFKLKMSEDQVLDRIKDTVSFARKLCPNIEWSCEDAGRSSIDFLFRCIEYRNPVCIHRIIPYELLTPLNGRFLTFRIHGFTGTREIRYFETRIINDRFGLRVTYNEIGMKKVFNHFHFSIFIGLFLDEYRISF